MVVLMNKINDEEVGQTDEKKFHFQLCFLRMQLKVEHLLCIKALKKISEYNK